MPDQHSASAVGRTVFPEPSAAPHNAPAVPQQQLPSAVHSPWGPDGRLTRAGMERVIAGGGSVLHPDHPGQVINDVRKLPSAATLARTPEERDAARDALIAQRQELDRQLGQIDTLDTQAEEKADADAAAAAEAAKAKAEKPPAAKK